MRDNKYPSLKVKPYFDKIMEKKRGEIEEIPFRDLEPLTEDQKGNYWDVCRRAFIQYLKDMLKEKGIEMKIKLDCRYTEGVPSLMGQLGSFKKLDHESQVILEKLMTTEDFLELCKKLT